MGVPKSGSHQKWLPPMRSARTTVRLALVQMRAEASPARNLEKAHGLVRKAAGVGAHIVCLQELFRTRYFCQSEDRRYFRSAEPIPGKTTRFFQRLAKKLNISLIVPIFERRTGGLYHNSVVLIDQEGALAGFYRKMHIPHDPCFYEKFYFAPGDLGFRVFKTPVARIGISICWDQWYPEVARLLALRGAEILFFPSAIGWLSGVDGASARIEKKAWKTVQIAHAVTNGVFVACVNRVGREGKITFWGSSFVADPRGAVLAEASQDKEEILFAECDLAEIRRVREEWPFLRDRRIDAYHELTRRYADAPSP